MSILYKRLIFIVLLQFLRHFSTFFFPLLSTRFNIAATKKCIYIIYYTVNIYFCQYVTKKERHFCRSVV